MIKAPTSERPNLKQPAPFLFKALASGLLASYLPGLIPGELGVSISFLGWMIPFFSAFFVVFKQYSKVLFPTRFWLLWVAWVILYIPFSSEEHVLQRGIMLLAPVVVGMAFSTLKVTDQQLDIARRWINNFTVIFLLSAGISNGLLSHGELADVTGFAAGAITATLLGCWYVAMYWQGIPRSQWAWLVLALVPVMANTRTAMAAMALTLPLTLTPIGNRKRLVAMMLIVVFGVFIFHTERIQKKMFYSGQGTLLDAIEGIGKTFDGEEDSTGDFATTGRKIMFYVLTAGLEEAYWFGHGANTTEALSMELAGVPHPHNDWLRLRYEYGQLGMLLFLATILVQTWHGWRAARSLPKESAALLYAGSSAFIPMMIMMSSDNVMLYAAWFGNLQFALLGLGYASTRKPPRPVNTA